MSKEQRRSAPTRSATGVSCLFMYRDESDLRASFSIGSRLFSPSAQSAIKNFAKNTRERDA